MTTMTRRSLAALMGLFALQGGRLDPLAGAPAAARSRPNVVLILTDDMRADDLASMDSVGRLLADQGTTFSSAIAATPLCCPSRASILTGRYAHNHGVLRNTGPDAGFATFHASDTENSTIATWLKDGGYRTGLLGKYLNGYPSDGVDRTYVPPGWDTWAAGVDHHAYEQFDYDLNEDGRIVSYGHKPGDYLTDVLAAKAIDFVKDAAAGRDAFFLYVAPYAPHSPNTPAPRYANDFGEVRAPRGPSFDERDVRDKPRWVSDTPPLSDAQIARIDADARDRFRSLQAVDDLVAGLVDTLDASGTLANTYVIFTSDNGGFLGEHRQAHGKNAPYEETIRVPLVVRGPGVPAGVTVDELALNVDLAPTFADLAGVSAPGSVDGRSLAPLLGGGSAAGWRDAVLVEGFGGDGDEEEGGSGEPTPPFAALRTADLLYAEYDTGERELYDLQADPDELTNLASRADGQTLSDLSARLEQLRRCSGSSCRSAEDAAVDVNLPASGGRKGRNRERGGNGGQQDAGNRRRRPARRDRAAKQESGGHGGGRRRQRRDRRARKRDRRARPNGDEKSRADGRRDRSRQRRRPGTPDRNRARRSGAAQRSSPRTG